MNAFVRTALPLLLTGLVVPAAAVAGEHAQALRAHLKTTEVLLPTTECGPAPFVGLSFGAGDASGLGKVTMTSGDCVQIVGGAMTFTNGQMQIGNRRGDHLLANYQGTMRPTETPGVMEMRGEFVIVGGGGRYRDARGGGELRGTTRMGETSAQSTINAIGTLRY